MSSKAGYKWHPALAPSPIRIQWMWLLLRLAVGGAVCWGSHTIQNSDLRCCVSSSRAFHRVFFFSSLYTAVFAVYITLNVVEKLSAHRKLVSSIRKTVNFSLSIKSNLNRNNYTWSFYYKTDIYKLKFNRDLFRTVNFRR